MRAIATRAGSILAAFALSVLVSRELGPDGAGAFFLVYTVVALGATAGRFGTDNLALRLLGGDSASPRHDVRLLTRAAAFAATVATLLCLPITLWLVGSDNAGTVAAAVSGVLPQSLSVLAGAYLRGLRRVSAGVLAELGSLPLIASSLIVALDLILPGGLTLGAALLALGAASWATAGWALPVALRAIRADLADGAGPPEGTREFLSRHVRKLLGMMGTSLLAYGVVWAPIFVLAATSTSAEVAFYSVALRLANIVALLPTIQVAYLAPEFARRFYSGNITDLNALAARSVQQVAALTALPVAVLVVAAPHIVTLAFGASFSDAAPLVAILSVGIFIAMLCGQVNQLMLICGLEHTALLLTTGLLVAWATLGPWIGAEAGALGVAWLGSLSTVIYAAAGAGLLQKRKAIRSYLWSVSGSGQRPHGVR